MFAYASSRTLVAKNPWRKPLLLILLIIDYRWVIPPGCDVVSSPSGSITCLQQNYHGVGNTRKWSSAAKRSSHVVQPWRQWFLNAMKRPSTKTFHFGASTTSRFPALHLAMSLANSSLLLRFSRWIWFNSTGYAMLLKKLELLSAIASGYASFVLPKLSTCSITR